MIIILLVLLLGISVHAFYHGVLKYKDYSFGFMLLLLWGSIYWLFYNYWGRLI